MNALVGQCTHNKQQGKQHNFNLMVLIDAFFENRISESNPCLGTQQGLSSSTLYLELSHLQQLHKNFSLIYSVLINLLTLVI